jgi:ribosomal protein S27AE
MIPEDDGAPTPEQEQEDQLAGCIPEECPYCGSTNLNENEGRTSCNECGEWWMEVMHI